MEDEEEPDALGTGAVGAAVVGERQHLLALAYRMLGTLADAEEAVQETFVRWYRLDPQDRAAVTSPRSWLTRTAGRVCLDLLGSARVRRERYVGDWLPEPLPGGAPLGSATAEDPLDRVTLDDEVGSALLVVLESLTPAERVAFVLHDVFATPHAEIATIVGRTPAACRQLASTARAKVRAHRAYGTAPGQRDDVTRAFADACRGGDLGRLLAVLDPAVELRSDGGGLVSAARRPVLGRDRVTRFLLGSLAKYPEARIDTVASVEGTVLLVHAGGRVQGVVWLGVAGHAVVDVWIMVNPEKLSRWSRLVPGGG